MSNRARSLRIAVGTVLLGLGGGCTSRGVEHINPGPEPVPAKREAKPPQKAPEKAPEKPPPEDHVNPGPNDEPAANPEKTKTSPPGVDDAPKG